MKEFIGGMAAAFGMVAAYNIIANRKKKDPENRVDDMLSQIHEDSYSNEKFPATIYESSDENGFYYGKNTLFNNNILIDRKHSSSPNGLIIGSTGTGKQWAAISEIEQVLDKTDDNVIIIEKEGFYSRDERISDRVVSVSPYDSNSEYHINPLDVYISDSYDMYENETITDITERTFSLIEEILGKRLNNAEKAVVADTVKDVFVPFLNYLKDNNLKCEYEKNPTLADIAKRIIDSDETDLRGKVMYIEEYINWYFSYKTYMPDDRAVILTWNDISPFLSSALYAGCVMYSWNRLLKNREEQKYLWIYLEDIDYLACRKAESTLSVIFELFKRSRPYGGIVTLIAQSAEDLRKSDIGNVIFAMAGFIRCLSCDCSDRDSISKMFGLHDEILDHITNAPIGSGLLISNDHIIPFNMKVG